MSSPRDEVGLERTSGPNLLRFDRKHRLAADGGEIACVQPGRSAQGHAHVVDRRAGGGPGAYLESAAEVLHADGVDE